MCYNVEAKHNFHNLGHVRKHGAVIAGENILQLTFNHIAVHIKLRCIGTKHLKRNCYNLNGQVLKTWS